MQRRYPSTILHTTIACARVIYRITEPLSYPTLIHNHTLSPLFLHTHPTLCQRMLEALYRFHSRFSSSSHPSEPSLVLDPIVTPTLFWTTSLLHWTQPAHFLHSKHSVVLHHTLYCTRFNLCNKLYVGQTGQPQADRFTEHLRDVLLRTNNSLTLHFRSNNNHFTSNIDVFSLALHHRSIQTLTGTALYFLSTNSNSFPTSHNTLLFMAVSTTSLKSKFFPYFIPYSSMFYLFSFFHCQLVFVSFIPLYTSFLPLYLFELYGFHDFFDCLIL